MPRVHRTSDGFYSGQTVSDDELEGMTKAELLDLADAEAVEVSSAATKAEIIAALRAD